MVTLLLILMVVAVPSLLKVSARWQLESAAWKLASDLRLAQQTAISTGKTTRVEFREFHGDYRMWLPTDLTRVRLPDGISYAANNFPISSGVRRVNFSPMGAPSQGGTVVLANKRGDKLYIITTPATGRVRVSKDPPANW